jgi:transcriptional regulator with XRE-family HTH domain
MRTLPKPNIRARVTVPERVSPHVKLVFAEMRRLGVTYDDVEEGSGVRRAALKAWRHKNRPSLESIEAALGYLGYDFVPVPRHKMLPKEVQDELGPLAEKLGLTMPQATACLIEIVAGIHERFPYLRDQMARNQIVVRERKKPRAALHPDQFTLLEAPNALQ